MGLKFVFILCIFSLILFSPSVVYSISAREYKTLAMFFKEEDLVVSPTRYAKPVSQTAENITIITAEDIEAMNAHTLTDILNTIPGIQIDIKGGPGIPANPYIQGSDFRHVLVLIDGVTLNNLSDNIADLGAIPVQHIKRIEVIKGPASSAWGSSLGGVINIITKSPTEIQEGTFSASYGEKDTGDFRAETSGRKGKLGYYLSAGNLHSDGLKPNMAVSINNFYTKMEFRLSDRADIHLTFGYNKGSRGFGEFPDFDLLFNNSYEYIFSTLSLNARISDNSAFNISFRTLRQDADYDMKQLSTGAELSKSTHNDETNGISAKLTFKPQSHTIVIGTDFDRGTLKSNQITGGQHSIEKQAVYINDTIILDKWSFAAGLRYDYTSTNGKFLSPSFGTTYKLDENTILRATIARGFSIPPLSTTFGTGFFFRPNPELDMEKVWSYQAGVETDALKYLWLKATVFRHDVKDAIADKRLPGRLFTKVNSDKIRRQGFEIETRTLPVYNTSLFAGFAFVDAEDRKTGETIKDVPRYTIDIGANYKTDNLKGTIRGHYIWWNSESFREGKYNCFIWDLNLIKTFHRNKKTLETFLTAHNLFNASQYRASIYKNPKRWIEAGLRLKY
jgi:vitamin B12 transporter